MKIYQRTVSFAICLMMLMSAIATTVEGSGNIDEGGGR